MKAYRIKYIIKNSKPPIWWRCLVPAGITFSALSVILNDISGIPQNETFTFELYKRLHIYEESKSRPLEATEWCYDVQEASSTFVDDYFDSEKRIRYYSGRNEYVIELEGCHTGVSAEDLPCVLKWKSEAGSDDLDQRIRTMYMVHEGTPKFLRKADIIAADTDGIRRFACDQFPRSAQDNLKKCSRHMMLDIARLLDSETSMHEKAKIIRTNMSDGDSKNLLEDDIFSLPHMLRTASKSDLIDIAQYLGMKKYSSLSSDELVERITVHLLDPDFMRSRFVLLTDSEIAAFEYVITERELADPTEELLADLDYLLSLAYAVEFQNDVVVIPTEVERLYEQINTEQFRSERRKMQYMQDIVNEIVPRYYSCIPIVDFCRLCSRTNNPVISVHEVMSLFERIPKERNFCYKTNGSIASIQLRDEDLFLSVQNAHANKPCYIMSQNEIDEVLRYGYPYTEPHYLRLKRFLTGTARIGAERADKILHDIHIKLAMAYDFDSIDQILGENDIIMSVENAMEFFRILTDVSNHTRTFINRGHTPTELFNRRKIAVAAKPTFIPLSTSAASMLLETQPQQGLTGVNADVNAAAIASIVHGRPGKVRPNDPCPCGSGKKYKKCCGR